MVHRPEGPTTRNESVVNLKELSDVKELVDEVLGILSECLDIVVAELGPFEAREPTGPGEGDGVDGMAVAGEGDDGPCDPLEDVESLLRQGFNTLAEVLNVTEPHRKRYAAQASSSMRAAKRAHVEPTTEGKEVASGTGTKARGKSLCRPIR